MSVTVLTSYVADGSMLKRSDPLNAAVIKNRKVFLEKHGVSLDQTTRLKVDTYNRAVIEHETDWLRYLEVTASHKGLAMRDDDIETADALITTEPGHALMLPVADCVGAVFYDETHGVTALAHLGRHSLEQQGGTHIVTHLQETYGTIPAEVKVWLTAAPSKEIYPIWALNNMGMKEAVFAQLFAAGIQFENITDDPAETDKDPNYYSYSEFLKGHRTEDGDYSITTMMTE